MIDDVAVLIADYLSGKTDPTKGVNAFLPLVPRRSNDPMPQPVQGFYDDTRDARIIEGEEPDQMPAIVVNVAGDLQLRLLGGSPLAPADTPSKAPLFVLASYITRVQDLPGARIAAGYTMDAVRRSFGALQYAPQAQKITNTTQLIEITRVVERRLFASKGASALLGIVLAQCRVRDLAQ